MAFSESENLKKGYHWTREEDQKLKDYMSQLQGKRETWDAIAINSGLKRPGANCRHRYMNYLKHDIKRGDFSEDEVQKIICLHSKLGNKWAKIAAELPGRTANDIKNYWRTHSKKTHPMANDPKTHEPRTDTNGILMNLMTTLENGLGSLPDPSHLAVFIGQLQHQADQYLGLHRSTLIFIEQLKALLPQLPSNSVEAPMAVEASEPQWENLTALSPPLPPLRECNYPLTLPSSPGIFPHQDPSNAEVNYSENPLMPDQSVSAAPSIDDPNQDHSGTDCEEIFRTPSPPLLP